MLPVPAIPTGVGADGEIVNGVLIAVLLIYAAVNQTRTLKRLIKSLGLVHVNLQRWNNPGNNPRCKLHIHEWGIAHKCSCALAQPHFISQRLIQKSLLASCSQALPETKIESSQASRNVWAMRPLNHTHHSDWEGILKLLHQEKKQYWDSGKKCTCKCLLSILSCSSLFYLRFL